jgi:hypothetical protein
MKTSLLDRINQIDWPRHINQIDKQGFTTVESLLTADECRRLSGLYAADSNFRSRVVMARHNFGKGEYKYFKYPLPEVVLELRSAVYPHLAALANRWNVKLGIPVSYPEEHRDFITRCHEAGQQRPTPLLLRYEAEDYNCLHQDLYGEHVFPIQLAVLLSDPASDFVGGEFVLTEQRPRMQSRATVVRMSQGDAVMFTVNHRPVDGARGPYRVTMRHGVSTVEAGERYTLGVIFHDAT